MWIDSRAGTCSSDMVLIFGFVTWPPTSCNQDLEFYFEWRIDTIIFAKLNKPPSNVLEINEARGGCLVEIYVKRDFRPKCEQIHQATYKIPLYSLCRLILAGCNYSSLFC